MFGLRPDECPLALRAALWLGAVSTGSFALRPVRDAMGLASGSAELHWLLTASFAATVLAIPVHGWAVARLGRRRLVRVVHRLGAAALVLFAVLLAEAPALRLWTARLLFVWTSVFNLTVISLFWSVTSERVASADAGRLVGPISVGGSIGALVGPALGGLLAWAAGPAAVLLAGAALLELGTWAADGAWADPATDEHARDPDGSAWAGLLALLGSPLLLGLGAYVLLLTANATTLYFIQARIIEQNFVDDRARMGVFAAIELAVNLASVVGQALLTGRLLARLGLGWSLAALPCLAGAGLLAFAAAPSLAVLIAVQGLRRVLDYVLARPARELVYTVVGQTHRYRAKPLIDTVVYRGGDALTGWTFAGLEALGLSLAAIAAIMTPLAGLWAAVGRRIGRASTAPAHPGSERSADR